MLTNLVGINFPAYAFENQAETEGFAKMAKRAGYEVIGLPNYVVWHMDTEEKPGNNIWDAHCNEKLVRPRLNAYTEFFKSR